MHIFIFVKFYIGNILFIQGKFHDLGKYHIVNNLRYKEHDDKILYSIVNIPNFNKNSMKTLPRLQYKYENLRLLASVSVKKVLMKMVMETMMMITMMISMIMAMMMMMMIVIQLVPVLSRLFNNSSSTLGRTSTLPLLFYHDDYDDDDLFYNDTDEDDDDDLFYHDADDADSRTNRHTFAFIQC